MAVAAQYLEGRKPIRTRRTIASRTSPCPIIGRHYVDFAAAGCVQQLPPQWPFGCATTTSFTCNAIVQPRRTEYAQGTDLQWDGLFMVVDTRAYRPARNIFGCFRRWPKTLSDAGFGEARFPAMIE